MTKIILALIIAVISADVTASNCPQFYPNNEPIVVPGTIELCNTFYVVVYDPKIKAPLFSSARMSGGKSDVERVNAFKSDARLDKSVRAETTDYKGTGFDKGHLTPAGAAKNQAHMVNTFLMSNMVPQQPEFNRGSWRQLEVNTLESIPTDSDTIVLTGAIYRAKASDKLTTIGDGIPVPISMYKLVYSTKPIAWYSENSAKPFVREVQFKQIQKLSGIKFPR